MEDKKTVKISLSTFICIIIIFILLLALVGLLFYFNFSNKNNSNLNEFTSSNQISNTVKNENKTNTIKEPTISSNELEQQNIIISTTTEDNDSKNKLKVDETKDIVYDAKYTYENLAGKSYKNEITEQVYFFNDIIVPYINIDSEDAVKANKEIKNIFEECAKFFKETLESNEHYGYKTSDYKYYINDNILSIIITVKSGGTAPIINQYYTYNFDLNTKKTLDYESVYKKIGFFSENINKKAENAVRNCSLYDGVGDDKNLNQYKNDSIQNYNKSVINNTIKFFLDSAKKLNIIVTIEIPTVQNGSYDEILTIE